MKLKKFSLKKFSFSRKHLAMPYAVFLVLFVIVPLVIVAAYAFTAPGGGFTLTNFSKAWEMNAFRVLQSCRLTAGER